MYKEKVLRFGFLSATSRQPSVDVGSGSGNPGWQGASTSTTQLDSNVWTHVAVTYSNSTIQFYVDGALVDTISQTYTMGSNNKAYSLSTATQSFDGRTDDVQNQLPAAARFRTPDILSSMLRSVWTECRI
jgi:hypothetical protein